MLSRIKDIVRRLSFQLTGFSPVTWIVAAFIVTYLYFFISPIFLNPDHVMKFLQYLPISKPIGDDLKLMLEFVRLWFETGNPYARDGNYPPLTYVFLVPLTGLDFPVAFSIVTWLTLLAFLILGAGLPIRMNPAGYSGAVLLLLLVSGLSSYGLQFEIERGQWNVMATVLALLAVWLFHFHHRLRWIAYALLTVAIQLKLYPGIFLLMFIRDWKAWRENVRFFLGMGAANATMLFILGPRVFVHFVGAVNRFASTGYPWRGNHSIDSFVKLTAKALANLQPDRFSWLPGIADVIVIILMVVVLGLLAVVTVQAHRRSRPGLDRYLLVGCTLVAMLLPAYSNDYKLAIATGPVAVLLCSEGFLQAEVIRPRWLFKLLVFVFSLAYFSTLYSYMNKPLLLKNNLPALMVMLVVTAAWALMDRGDTPEPSGAEA